MHRTALVGVVIAAGLGLVAQQNAFASNSPGLVPDWTLTTPSQIVGPPATSGNASRAVVATGSHLYPINATTGALLPSLTVSVVSGPTVIQNEIGETAIFATTPDQELLRVSGDSGTLRWMRDVGGRCSLAPLPSQPAVVLHAFASTQPAFLMRYPLGTDLVVAWQPPVCDRSGKSSAPAGGLLAAYRSTDGTPAWSVATSGRIALAPLPDPLSGRIYAIDLLGNSSLVEAYAIDDGRLLWRAPVATSTLPPVRSGGRVYALARTGELYSLDAETGKQAWMMKLSGSFVSGLMARSYGSQRYVVAIDSAGHVTGAVDTGNAGSVLWTTDLSGGVPGAFTVAEVEPLLQDLAFDPGPFAWVTGEDGRLSQLVLDKHTFGPDDPLVGCRGKTMFGGTVVASRQLPGTVAGSTFAPTWASLYRPASGLGAKLVAAGSTTTLQLSVPWDCFSTGVGTASLQPRQQTVGRGGRFALALSWRHPRRWRELSYLQLRLRRGDRIVGWTMLDRQRRTLRLWTGRKGTFSAAARPGARVVRHGGGAFLDLARSTQGDDGKGGRTLRYRAALRLSGTVPAGRYTVEALAADATGAVQGFEPIGSVTVRR